jgi:hypothetical protein
MKKSGRRSSAKLLTCDEARTWRSGFRPPTLVHALPPSDPALEINRLGSPLQRTPLIVACTGADSGAATALILGEE